MASQYGNMSADNLRQAIAYNESVLAQPYRGVGGADTVNFMNNSTRAGWTIRELKNELAQRERDDRIAAQQASQQQTIARLAESADPFKSQRGQYQGQLRDLMSNPSAAIQNNPFFKASADAGQEAAMRRLRQIGMGDSGNAALELQKSAQANMSGDYFKLADLLGGFSGAKADPSAGANAALNAMKLFEDQRQYDEQTNKFRHLPGVNAAPRTESLSSLGTYWGK